jgi:two-component system sensor histidine kinase KdpD
MEQRPDPDRLLRQLKEEEAKAQLGKLKLFFGMSAGVGKTYAMLEAARQRKKEGWDVVVGVVETHGRRETEALAEGLQFLPRKEVPYCGVVLREFDLDAALARRPRLVLVDELAHTNAPGLRHTKRWQDVEELLDAGIDVYTTLNVQHWESLNDVVAQITGVVVRETVPDTFLRRAHELELVDIAPEDLLQRLRDGKVYQGEQAGRAAENFFQPGNLIALRELALRHAAERVDAQMAAFRELHAISDVWPVGDRLLVGVSPSPMSARLVRAASRLATRLRAPWLAVHVETPASLRLPPQERGRVIDNLRLAEKLGAETATVTGEDAVEALLAFARSRNVTRILLGKPAQPRWREMVFGSLVGRMARLCGDIDLHVISGLGEAVDHSPVPAAPKQVPWAGMAWGVATVCACTLLAWPWSRFIDRTNLVMIYLLGVSWMAYRFGRFPGMVTSALSVLAFGFFFVPPYLSFGVGDTQYLFTFLVMLGFGLFISALTDRLRRQTEQMRKREDRIRALYRLSREMSETPEPQELLERACRRLETFFGLPVLLVIPGPDRALTVAAGDCAKFSFDDRERGVAQWVFDHGQRAGAGTDTLAGAGGLYVPLRGIQTIVGVLGIRPAEAKALMDPEQVQLVDTFAAEIGGALESTRMSEEIGRADMQMEMQALTQAKAGGRLLVSDYLAQDRIVVFPEPTAKEEVFRQLLARMSLPNPAQAMQALLERERTGSTRLGAGLAIPHARLPGLSRLVAALGVLPAGLADEAQPQDPTRLCLLFFGPAENVKEHLAFLAGMSRLFQTPGLADALVRSPAAGQVLALLREAEQSLPR